MTDTKTDLLALPESALRSLALNRLPARLDDHLLGALDKIATTPVERTPATELQIIRTINILATMRSQNTGESTGKLATKLYERVLSDHTGEELAHLSEVAVSSLDWRPSPAECKRIMAAWTDTGQLRAEKAGRLAAKERQHRAVDVFAAIKRGELDQAAIDALPVAWKGIAAERMLLWRGPRGQFAIRRDVSQMSEDEAQAERIRVRDLFAEWEKEL